MEYSKEELQRFIADQVEENGQLEYKAARALSRDNAATDEITKDISAFANATGGVLIYGVAEHGDKSKRYLPERLDPVDQTQFSREWLDQKAGLIRPRIEGLKITPVHVGPSDSAYCYVVEVPQGATAHQARDLRYYQRRNFEVTAMEDYEVREAMRRRKDPKIKVRIFMGLSLHSNTSSLVCNLENISSVLARSVYCVIEVPLDFVGRSFRYDLGDLIEDDDGTTFWRLRVSNDGKRPLFPGSDYSQSFVATEYGGPRRKRDATGEAITKTIPYVRVKVFADEMPFFEESFDPKEIIVRTEF